MWSINQCTFGGNVGRDPDLSYLPSGISVANFNLAMSKQVGQDREKTTTTWIRITCFGKWADAVKQFVKKGDAIVVHGELREVKWEKDGQKNRFHECLANGGVFKLILPSKKEEGSGPNEEEVPF